MIKKFLEFAIDRPVLNHIVLVFTIIMSIFAYKMIPKEIFPPSQLDQVSIVGTYAGASADVLDKMAVKSIEDELKGLPEIETVYSSIQNGLFSIQADIVPNSDNQMVLGDVKDILSNLKRDLPSDMDEPIAKITVHAFPLLVVAISGEKSSIEQLLTVGQKLKERLTLIPNLSNIDIRGESDEEILIQLNQDKIDGYGISKSALYSAISSLSSIFPVGTIKEKGNHLYISTINGEKSKDALEKTLLSVDGKRLYLGDIATVKLGLAEPKQLSHYNGKLNISLDIQKTKEGNAIALSKEVRATLKEFSQEYKDKGVEFEVYTDTSIWVKNRLNLVSSNIIFGLILVMLALFLTVNYRIALVVGIGIPTAFMITLIAIDMMGYSLNMLTLLGALIALGMLVDEAIVVAENIYRHIEMGKSPREASIDGAVEMFPAIITATFTTIFAFLPMLIMTGQMGIFIKVIPVMISILLISSLFEAFYFLPLHSKEFYSVGKIEKEEKKESRFWSSLKDFYIRILNALLRFKKLSLLLLVSLIMVGTVAMAKITKMEFMPEFDVQQVYLNGVVNVNNRLTDTEKYVTMIEKALLKYLDKNAVDSVTSVIGFKMNADKSIERGDNLFHIFINLHEKAPENFFDTYINPVFSLEYDDSDMIRTKKAQTIAQEIQDGLLEKMRKLEVNGEKVFEEFNIFAQQTGMVGHDIEIGFSDINPAKIAKALKLVEDKLYGIKGVEDIGTDAKEGEKELKLRVNEYGQSLGLSEGYITKTLRGSFFQGEYAKMFNEEGLLRVKVEDKFKDNRSAIENFKLTTPNGSVVVLKEVCDFYYQKSLVRIFKEDAMRVSSVYARVDKKVTLSVDVMDALKPTIQSLRDMGIKVIIKGEQKANSQMMKEMSQAGVIALFLIFITLVWMFNSFLQPLIILSIIPLSLLGVLVGTKVMGLNLSMTGAMGIIGLAGVVVNDGLIMLEFVRRAKNTQEILTYASWRLRPIVLTSVTTVLGLFTLMFFASGQALILQPMAVSLGFGVAWATVLNLYFVPLMYAVIYRIKPKNSI